MNKVLLNRTKLKEQLFNLIFHFPSREQLEAKFLKKKKKGRGKKKKRRSYLSPDFEECLHVSPKWSHVYCVESAGFLTAVQCPIKSPRYLATRRMTKTASATR